MGWFSRDLALTETPSQGRVPAIVRVHTANRPSRECTQSCVCYVKLGLLAQEGPFTNGCRLCQNEKLPYLLTLTS